VGQFSKGMRVRLNVARALLNRPELLFVDEPTAGLDPGSSRRIRELIRQRRDSGSTIFLSTHDLAVADQLCDRVAFLVDGRIELIDAPRTLKLRYGRRALRVEYGSDGRLEQRDFPLEGLADNAEFQALLRRETIQTVHTLETTLEDIFIQLTGRTLR
jgi:fluoroquinolone transport system ATP-binding protein